MGREETMRPHPTRPKLTEVIRRAYPGATEIFAPFVDDLRYVGRVEITDPPLYIARFLTDRERPRREQFPDLPDEINLTLTRYRDYRLFQPWPQPIITVTLNTVTNGGSLGRVAGYGPLRVSLKQLGQAQVWYGPTYAVLHECYITESHRPEPWKDELRAFWEAVESDLGASMIFTEPHDPAFEDGYTDFLTLLGYQPDPQYHRWWRKDQKISDPSSTSGQV